MSASIASGQPTSTARSLPQIMRQHPLFFYFLMAYAFSWVVVTPYILSEWGLLPKFFVIAFDLNAFAGPTLAAIIMTRITAGPQGVRRLLRRCVQWRAGWPWYLFVLLGIPALFLLGIMGLPGALASFQGLPPGFPVVYLVNFVIIFLLGGPLGEEIGWRGFALPRMQPRYGPLWGTLLLGVLWAGWHLPHFLTAAQRGGPGASLATILTNLCIFSVMVVALAVIFTWVFNHTQGSLFIAMLLHASVNTFGVVVVPLFAAPLVTGTDLELLIGAVLLAVLLIILTRGRLGYRAEEAQSQAPE